MSTEKEQIGEIDVEDALSYQPPPQKTIEEIIAADQEDESLRKYKEALLGAAQTEKIIVGKLFGLLFSLLLRFMIISFIFYCKYIMFSLLLHLISFSFLYSIHL